MKEKFTIEDMTGEAFPLITLAEFCDKIDQAICQEISYDIKLERGSTIRGKGVLVYGAGGNTDELIIATYDQETGRLCDIRFNKHTIIWSTEYFRIKMINKKWR